MPADILTSNPPALSATSDTPQVDNVVDNTVATEPAAAPTTETTPATTTEQPATAPTPTPTEGSSTEGPMWARERLGTLAAQRREADARAARLESLVQQQTEQTRILLERLNSTTAAPPSTAPNGDDTAFNDSRPARESFPDPESFESALVTWAGQKAAHEATALMSKRAQEEAEQRADRERKEAETKAQEEAVAEQNRRVTEIATKWEERKVAAVERHPDFLETIQNEDLMIPAGSYVAHAVLTREDGTEIGYYLGKNLEEARRIASLTIPGQFIPAGNPNAGMPQPDFIAQAYEIGKIAAKLEAQAAAKPAPASTTTPTETGETTAPVTNALATTATTTPTTIAILPTPPTPISGASAEATQRSPENESMEEYAARRMRVLQAERRPGRSIN